ncbi:hypothetical protein ASPWEDRAFT_37551 [Aspergillus wentii DTO 134E9]|uniref:Uncharacterized protein n=1 Tax=Aspergillus wentii DTO 134E9 TaxID=1073089 RepID=A0A1L9RXZ1_ASPWE|nr:uncharacterized protein ASPWEDRAFT_37551 [Aspergillus wentii DTO 134E9]OJJ39717.1 hypothetical protein ASPWEDRAFT_37551 [Aspergillus wentii DTO 134E9]
MMRIRSPERSNNSRHFWSSWLFSVYWISVHWISVHWTWVNMIKNGMGHGGWDMIKDIGGII